MDDKAILRKYEDDLNVSGSGVIIMGVWSALKGIIEIFLGSENLIDLSDSDRMTKIIGTIIFVLIILAVVAVIICIHYYIGINAIKAARGQEYKKGYLTGAVIMLVLSVLSMLSYKDMFEESKNIETFIASILVDLTTIYVFAAVIRYTYLIRKFKERQM